LLTRGIEADICFACGHTGRQGGPFVALFTVPARSGTKVFLQPDIRRYVHAANHGCTGQLIDDHNGQEIGPGHLNSHTLAGFYQPASRTAN